jgi:DNA-binding transcriptional LysR family regulator
MLRRHAVELRPLRYFAAVARTGTVTAAATELHMTQPALSRQLRDLERQLGVGLFARTQGRLHLSAAGRQFLPLVEELLSRADALVTAARDIAAGRMEQLTVAAPGTTLTDVVAPFLATLGPADPMPAVWEQVPTTVYASLSRGADLAIGTAPPPAALAGSAVADLPIWAYVPPSHEWAGRASVAVSELVDQSLLLLTRDFHPRRALDHALADARLAPVDVHEFATAEVAQAVAASGRGVAVVSDDPRFGLVPLAVDGAHGPVTISLYAAWDPQHHGAAVIGDIAARLARFCVARYGEHVRPVTDTGHR